jgi:hypothetical protein
MKEFLVRFFVTFAVAFTVNAAVIYVWNFIHKGDGIFKWEQAFVTALIIGIILPLTTETGRSR